MAASAAGYLSAWIDFNSDGDWSDAGEQVFADQALGPGANALSFAVPQTPPGVTYARFRFSDDTGLSLSGPATDGLQLGIYNYYDGRFVLIDTATRSVTAQVTVPTGAYDDEVAFSPDGSRA